MKTLLRHTSAVSRWLLLLSLLPLSTCSPKLSTLGRIQAAGRLVVATTNSPTTCYDGPEGLTGFECDLLQGLARKLGVQLELQFFDTTPEAVEALAAHKADLAAAGIGITPERQAQVRFSMPLQQVTLQLVYQGGNKAPQNLDELKGELNVIPGSAGEAALQALKASHPDLNWKAAEADEDVDDLLYQVSKGDLDYTVASSDLIAIDQHSYPNLRVAFAVSDKSDLAWALPQGGDDSLYKAMQEYLRDQLGQGEVARLRDRYFSNIGQTDYQGVVRFTADVQSRLPRYRPYFMDAAKRYGLDWRVIAAIGYQESHWDPAAISPTGVRGLMMLTTDTAALLEVDRENAAQSIRGGAQYFQHIMAELPPQIVDPDRTWMALAAYNQGIGHLLDARALAAELGGDPNRWVDVRNTLPLLSREHWFRKTRYGYARGLEAVGFVGNVRNYYDMLTWMIREENAAPQPQTAETGDAGLTRVAAIRSAGARPRFH